MLKNGTTSSPNLIRFESAPFVDLLFSATCICISSELKDNKAMQTENMKWILWWKCTLAIRSKPCRCFVGSLCNLFSAGMKMATEKHGLHESVSGSGKSHLPKCMCIMGASYGLVTGLPPCEVVISKGGGGVYGYLLGPIFAPAKGFLWLSEVSKGFRMKST